MIPASACLALPACGSSLLGDLPPSGRAQGSGAGHASESGGASGLMWFLEFYRLQLRRLSGRLLDDLPRALIGITRALRVRDSHGPIVAHRPAAYRGLAYAN